MSKDKKVVDSLAEDKARRDASYEYGKGSAEPVAEGAFKGALASGLAARFIPSSKKGGSNWKAHAANLAVGTIGGGLAGKLYNNSKVNDAKKAREYLADKRKQRAYIKETKEIYKDAADRQLYGQDPYRLALEAAEDQKPKKRPGKEIIKDTALGGIIGAGLGALTKGRGRLMSVKRGAAIGGAGVAASDITDRGTEETGLNKSRAGQILGMGASFAASGAVEPTVNRLLGRYSKDSEYIKEQYAKKAKGTKGFFSNKNGIDGHGAEFLKGHKTKGKSIKGIFKGIGKPTLKAAGKYGLIGLGVGTGIDYITRKLQKEASVVFSAGQAIKAKEFKAKKEIDRNIAAETALEFGGAGLAYAGVAKAMRANKKSFIAGATAGATYLAGRAIGKMRDKMEAKEYMSKTRGEKLALLKQEVDDEHIGPTDMYKAVALNAIIGRR